MLSLKQIQEYYPENFRSFKRNIVREYLQYKILEIIFDSKFANQLSFLDGTALRIIYDNTRFSEDLDFDNFGLKADEFFSLTKEIKKKLEKQGYQIEIRNVFKSAYRCYIKLPKILFDNELSNFEEEKILIQVDTVPHHFAYQPDPKILHKFDVFTQIKVTPIDILLAQKFYAIFNRKRTQGRDFFDVIFLLGKTKPNYEYLKEKIGVDNDNALKEKLLAHSKKLDFHHLAEDIEPFLFYPGDSKKVQLFINSIEQINL